ncbi:Protein NEN1-like [Quillaja saponaria]|uniref:Protein NEN1-like n=1 Tax=Quillaja saponaria TaxID=32244 RepID=A0AAD7LE24_QUISA|nr:Protein NEN1-like [Quillaja saponaria]
MGSSEDRSEIVFFDIETSAPSRSVEGFAILEFGAILVCPRKLVELESYSTLVRPADLSHISSLSKRSNGITRDAVISAPTFTDIADKVYDILHGRIWAGHNILRFDCVRIRDAFSQINRPAPEPKGTIDSLALLTRRFGRRAGDMKMATLATYFGLGQQIHRSLDDVRMNLEVLKYCATVLFLESSLPDIFTENSWVSPNATTRSRSNGKPSPEGASINMVNLSPSMKLKKDSTSLSSTTNQSKEEIHPIYSILTSITEEAVSTSIGPKIAQSDLFNMGPLSNTMERESPQPDVTSKENSIQELLEASSSSLLSDGSSNSVGYLQPDDICISSISATLVPFYRGSRRIGLLHDGVPLQLCCTGLKVWFGISTKFVDHAGRPRLSFVVNASPNLCMVLDACDSIAQKLSLESDRSSDWRPVVTRKEGFFNYPTVRLHIPTAVCSNLAIYATEIYQKESSGDVQRLVFSKFDAAELGTLFLPGTFVDAFFSLDPYDYQQSAGIRLVAKKLIIHCKL